MSNLIKMQFRMTRDSLFKEIEGLRESLDVQPRGFNNTIHWHVGHILVVTEKFLFPENGKLPTKYKELFDTGSKPSEWEWEVPAMESLVQQLKDQQNRIMEIPDERFADKMPEPVFGVNTYGEVVSIIAHHESHHSGQIHAMKRLVE
ncbi:DinB family protein [Oceanobacillus senegalensis]|uniref:DinB family protein n=1 Tax=Oceanobacillus senegalensis TaxID=1936063 RepID=UPI000A30BE83|nr:DinB family protein [Oceanobacillus senegalensis]